MDYEKKYKDALSRARSMYESQDDAELAAYIFPELAESEDERIRKFLIKLVNDGLTSFPDSLTRSDVLAYLEKQKESTWTEEDESFRKHILPRILNPTSWTLEQVEADRKLLKEFVERQKSKWVFKAGAEWQASQMPMPEDTVLFNKGVQEGRRLEREDMMKEAIECEIDWYDGPILNYSIDESCEVLSKMGVDVGDKVRIVVLKEEE